MLERFDTSAIDEQVWDIQFKPDIVPGTVVVAQDGGQLSFTIDDVIGYNSVTSKDRISLVGGHLTVRVPETIDSRSTAEQGFQIQFADNQHAAIVHGRGDFVLNRWAGGAATDDVEVVVPWDDQAFRYWRFESEAGELLLRTSADGTTWTTHVRGRTFPLEAVKVRMFAGANPASPVPTGQARFDDLVLTNDLCPGVAPF